MCEDIEKDGCSKIESGLETSRMQKLTMVGRWLARDGLEMRFKNLLRNIIREYDEISESGNAVIDKLQVSI